MPSVLVAYAVNDLFPPGTASYHIFQTFGASRSIARGPILRLSIAPGCPFVSSGLPAYRTSGASSAAPALDDAASAASSARHPPSVVPTDAPRCLIRASAPGRVACAAAHVAIRAQRSRTRGVDP